MRKFLIFAVLAIGMMVSAQAQENIAPIKKGQVFVVVKGDKASSSKIISKTNKGIRVIKGTVEKRGKDTFMYMTLEDGMELVFKNNVLIGGIR